MPKMYTAKQVIKEVDRLVDGGKSVGEALKTFGLTRGQWSGMTYRYSQDTLNNNATYSKGGKAKKKKPLSAAKKKALKKIGKRLDKAVSKETPTPRESVGKRSEMYRSLLNASKEESKRLEVEQQSLLALINE